MIFCQITECITVPGGCFRFCIGQFLSVKFNLSNLIPFFDEETVILTTSPYWVLVFTSVPAKT